MNEVVRAGAIELILTFTSRWAPANGSADLPLGVISPDDSEST
jgi:hypothetical protein